MALPESVMLGPMMAATFWSLISFVAATTAFVGLLWSSSIKSSIGRPRTPPFLFTSSTTAIAASFIGLPINPPHPVMLNTTPNLMGSAAAAGFNAAEHITTSAKETTRNLLNRTEISHFMPIPPRLCVLTPLSRSRDFTDLKRLPQHGTASSAYRSRPACTEAFSLPRSPCCNLYP